MNQKHKKYQTCSNPSLQGVVINLACNSPGLLHNNFRYQVLFRKYQNPYMLFKQTIVNILYITFLAIINVMKDYAGEL